MAVNTETPTFILEVVKVMIPVLTGLLAIVAGGVGNQWRQKAVVTRLDIVVVVIIALLGASSFAAWATALAGAMRYTAEPDAKLLCQAALPLARDSVGYGYLLLMTTAFSSGAYYLYLLATSPRSR